MIAARTQHVWLSSDRHLRSLVVVSLSTGAQSVLSCIVASTFILLTVESRKCS